MDGRWCGHLGRKISLPLVEGMTGVRRRSAVVCRDLAWLEAGWPRDATCIDMRRVYPPFEKTPPKLLSLARVLRRRQTDAERVMWHLVRRRQLGVKFRRQHPIEPYVLDFYCHRLRLAVEVDGAGHVQPTKRAEDRERSAVLQAQGIKVVRFTNVEVLQETEAVAEALWLACEERRDTREGGERLCP